MRCRAAHGALLASSPPFLLASILAGDVWDPFGASQEQATVNLARSRSREHHINGNAPMDPVLHLTPPPELALRTHLEWVLGDAGEALFGHREEGLHRSGYDHWYRMLHEYLVGGSTVRCLEAQESPGAAPLPGPSPSGSPLFPRHSPLDSVLPRSRISREDDPT